MPYCEQCGTEYKEGYQFCENCGAGLVQSGIRKTQPFVKHAVPMRNYFWLIAIVLIFSGLSVMASLPHLNKTFLNKLSIKAKARKPIARVQAGSSSFYVDKERMLIQYSSSSANLPVISISKDETAGIQAGSVCNSEQLRLALSLLEKINARGKFKGNVTAIDATSKYGDLFFLMSNGIEIRIGKKDLAEKLKALELLFSGKRINPEEIEYIDLRFNDIVIKEKNKS